VDYAKEFLQFMGQGECELRQLFEMGAAPQGASEQREVARV
jgi:hypothetical protein